jgi:hypothetical protein
MHVYMFVCVCVCVYASVTIINQFFLQNTKRSLWETTRLLERNGINIFPSSFKAEDNTAEKCNKRWHVKYALKYCVTPEKLNKKMSDIEQK